ncbi:MAG: porin family protein [Candidatus Thiothrix putei]|uniref:Porin family protein n=1 Tax=Candidatus Thiothrix putei TaxID=3080811 RepID=A0AA95H8W8_9GAMM|nr:MAG: porin family protein [Candidatus Thiothrix putei]
MKAYSLICLLSVIVSPTTLLAEDLFAANETSPGQFYAGFSLLKSDAECSFQNIACDSTGYKLATGYKFNNSLAIEGGYYNLFSNDGVSASTSEKSTVKGSGLALSTIGSYAVDDKTSLSGRVGIMAWDAEANTNGIPVNGMNGTDILLGVGAGYKLNDHWQLRGEYEHVGGDLEAKIYSLGTTLSTL